MTTRRRVAIMQPYFLPYIGYWQLMSNVDVFVVYDDVEYAKKGWINRNRYLANGHVETFTLPIKKGSDFLDVCERFIADSFESERRKLVRRIEAAYRRAPYFEEGMHLLSEIVQCPERNLFDFLLHSILKVRSSLRITSTMLVSSDLGVCRDLKGQDRVIETCKKVGATEYINPIGGKPLYEGSVFKESGIQLLFQHVGAVEYRQFDPIFVPNLSILDCTMFLGCDGVNELLGNMACEIGS